jgi:hypothetical protein
VQGFASGLYDHGMQGFAQNLQLFSSICVVTLHHASVVYLTNETDGELTQEPMAPVTQMYEFGVPGNNGAPPTSTPLIFLADSPVTAFEIPQVC